MIRSLAHVALQVTNLEGSLRHASEILGMRVVERVDGRVYLTLGSQHNTYGGAHHVIEYFEGPVTALEHVAFRADNAEALEQLRHRLHRAGVAVRAGEPEPGLMGAIRFKSPCGHEFEVFFRLGPLTKGLYGNWSSASTNPAHQSKRIRSRFNVRVHDNRARLSRLRLRVRRWRASSGIPAL
jgi:catechol 2,3-dioxygenase